MCSKTCTATYSWPVVVLPVWLLPCRQPAVVPGSPPSPAGAAAAAAPAAVADAAGGGANEAAGGEYGAEHISHLLVLKMLMKVHTPQVQSPSGLGAGGGGTGFGSSCCCCCAAKASENPGIASPKMLPPEPPSAPIAAAATAATVAAGGTARGGRLPTPTLACSSR